MRGRTEVRQMIAEALQLGEVEATTIVTLLDCIAHAIVWNRYSHLKSKLLHTASKIVSAIGQSAQQYLASSLKRGFRLAGALREVRHRS